MPQTPPTPQASQPVQTAQTPQTPETAQTPHLPRLGQALRALLENRCTLSLGTLGTQGPQAGHPFVSMTPFAIDANHKCLVIHVSALAAHTTNMAQHPQVGVMICGAEAGNEAVHDLQRVSFDAVALTPASGSVEHTCARQAYLKRFAGQKMMETMEQLPDFRFVTLHITGARQVAGFGVARHVGLEEIEQILASCH